MPRAGAQLLLRFPGEQQKPDKRGVPSDSHSRNVRQVRVCMIEVRVVGTWGAQGSLVAAGDFLYSDAGGGTACLQMSNFTVLLTLTICNPHSPDLPGVFRHPFPKNLWGEFFLHPRLPHSAALGGLGALTLQHAHNNCSETPTCWQGLKCNLRPSRPFPAPLRPRPLATVRRGALGPSAPPQRQGSERAQVSWVRYPLALSHRPSTVSHKTLGSTAQPRARPGLLGAAVGTPKKGV